MEGDASSSWIGSLVGRVGDYVRQYLPSSDVEEEKSQTVAEKDEKFPVAEEDEKFPVAEEDEKFPVAEEDEKKDETGEARVCEFYLANRCRFGARCRNLHPGEVAAETKEPLPGDAKGKKGSMKTAGDVISRIRWDENFPEEFFVVGYADRFLGVVEKPFGAFNWHDDLAAVDNDTLAIPQHRIRYFKYRTRKVWDKEQRLDLVFNSSGGEGANILDVMKEEDEACSRNVRSESDEGSDSDDDLEVTMGPGARIPQGVPESERSTHFLAIRITNPAIVAKAIEIHDHIASMEPTLRECCMRRGLFHVTLGMLRLDGSFAVEEARRRVEDLRATLEKTCREDATLKVAGLATFGSRVLYARVAPSPAFWRVASLLRDALDDPERGLAPTNAFDLVPHMTLVKVSRPVARERRSKYLDPSLYIKYENVDFGVQVIDNVNLCVIDDTTREDGFYRTLAEILF
ncbi:unnamed protein product [Darwinula stevensoni]|uniref:C3H1-type domain-containing protein n=1 Tax=Darwinula stevensoni TaxID=69355 RepID=A0A7R8X346_9CRUS|nr:unnamed protein product [Darwinula stevensoni]CAG0884608.1 unnamed protein product [Darwinula stevensoni]